MRTINVLLFISILTFFISCNSDSYEEHEIGDNLIDQTTDVSLVDTFSIESSTVIMDSVITSGYTSATLGRYDDEYLGDVKSEYYGVLSLNGAFNRSSIDGSVEDVPIRFDSLVFIAYPSGEYYGDTLQTQRVIINRINEDIELPDNEFSFFGHSSFTYDSEPLLDAEFELNPIKQSEYNADIDAHKEDYYGEYFGEGIFIKMESAEAIALGEDIVEKVNEQSDSVTESIQWQKYMKGIVIRPGDNNSVMFRVPLADNRLKLRLYYSDTDYTDAGKQKFHDFPISSSGNNESLSFMNYSSDRSGTPQQLDRLVAQDVELASEETDDLAFIQGGIGMFTKLRIPHIENLNTLGLTGGILGAELVMYPKDNSFDDEMFFLPKEGNGTLRGGHILYTTNISLYNTNENNKFNSALISSSANSNLTMTYVENQANEDESYYSADVTSFVNDVLINGQEYDDALLIGLPVETIGNNFERLIVENDLESDFRIRLRVTYVIQR
ncbi:DUF4270 family protein [Marinifilum caeruleilacunae]|nr:DUF4270 family protein [Marinifilum caeruleilacunae]